MPQIANASFVPSYTDHLPMGIESSLVVHLKRYSRNLVEQTFMVIEEPETPLKIPVKTVLFGFPPQIRTIGQFYAAIRAEIVRQGNSIFTGNPSRQVAGPLGAVAVTDVDSAVVAINTIVEQGEGTPTSPASATGVAHYYRFEELAKGMKIMPDPASPLKFSFDPAQTIAIDDARDVIQMVDDPPLQQFDGKVGGLADACDAAYSKLLRALQGVFDGAPGQIEDAIGLMRDELEQAIKDVLGAPIESGPHQGLHGGPRFKYVA
ncbi:ferritin-like domain-containing protein [Bradyrhizobium sp. RT6a]|uniref:ferritin-like domain-containing protein n=1 Tax=Bradyrhizobium sp. RT6a TaxID=3156381 RepID=UPI003393F436